MKKVVLVFVALGLLAVGLLIFTSRSSFRHPGLTTSVGGAAKEMETKSRSFLEDLQFKDFEKAASYHSREDRKKVNIPQLIERMFAVKPEFLDIMSYEIVKIQFDNSGKRCRVKTKTKVKILNTNEIKEPEIILYWFKDPAEGWIMELESSLH